MDKWHTLIVNWHTVIAKLLVTFNVLYLPPSLQSIRMYILNGWRLIFITLEGQEGFVVLVDRLSGHGSGFGFTVSVGSCVGMVSNEGRVWLVTGGRVINDGGGVPTPVSDLAGVAGEVWSFLLCGDSGEVVMGSRGNGEVAVLSWSGVDLEGGRQCPVGWTFVGVVGTQE